MAASRRLPIRCIRVEDDRLSQPDGIEKSRQASLRRNENLEVGEFPHEIFLDSDSEFPPDRAERFGGRAAVKIREDFENSGREVERIGARVTDDADPFVAGGDDLKSTGREP